MLQTTGNYYLYKLGFVCPSWKQRDRSQLSVSLLLPDSTTHQLSKGFWRALLALWMDKNQDEVGKSSGDIPVHYKRSRTGWHWYMGFLLMIFFSPHHYPCPPTLYLSGLKNNVAFLDEEISYPNVSFCMGGLT